MARMSITIPEDQAQGFKRLAKKHNMSPELLVKQAVAAYVFKQEWKEVQKIGVKIAERLGIKTEEDVTRMFDKH